MTDGQGTQQVPDEVEWAVMDCGIHWRMSGIPEETVRDMETELEGHLKEATEKGRSVEEVVGADNREFAEEWAREARPERSLFGWALELGWAFTFGVAFVAVVYHLFRWSLRFQIDGSMIVPVALIVWTASSFLSSSLAEANLTRSRWKRWLLAGGVGALIVSVPLGIVWVSTGSHKTTFFEWNWTFTVGTVGAHLVLSSLKKHVGLR